ncbi:MAG: biotin/lipoyl-binding protein, partial [Candidatus Deferrimicrobium sp.]
MNGVTRMYALGGRVAAAAVILWMAAGLSACGEKGKQGEAVSRPLVQGVEVVVVRPVPRETMVEALGTVRARTTAAVAPQVMGRLTGVAVSEGSAVAAGTLLATIDDTTVRAQLSSAEGAVAEA